jgi:hypothetical protein
LNRAALKRPKPLVEHRLEWLNLVSRCEVYFRAMALSN